MGFSDFCDLTLSERKTLMSIHDKQMKAEEKLANGG